MVACFRKFFSVEQAAPRIVGAGSERVDAVNSHSAHDLVTLRAGDTQLDLAPAIGGAVARFRWRDVDLFRPATAAAISCGDVLGMASFSLVPFAGRIRRGRFWFADHDVRLPVNLAGEPDAIHGHGWQAPWSIVDRSESAATLRFEYPGEDWPWPYRAEQTFTLADGDLTHGLSVVNRSRSPMPAGLGLHPFFPRPSGTRLSAHIDGVFLSPERPAVSPPPLWDWRLDPVVDAFVDHQFEGWNGEARVSWPSHGLALTLSTRPTTRRLVVYAPAGGTYFCVEPVSHQLDGVNRSPGGSAHGMVLLASGETLAITARFSVGPDLTLADSRLKGQR